MPVATFDLLSRFRNTPHVFGTICKGRHSAESRLRAIHRTSAHHGCTLWPPLIAKRMLAFGKLPIGVLLSVQQCLIIHSNSSALEQFRFWKIELLQGTMRSHRKRQIRDKRSPCFHDLIFGVGQEVASGLVETTPRTRMYM